jgi:hypothetical protein
MKSYTIKTEPDLVFDTVREMKTSAGKYRRGSDSY